MVGEAGPAATPPEAQDSDRVSMAQRHVIEAEDAVARQIMVVEDLEKGHHQRAAAGAKKTLEMLQGILKGAREHLHVETGSPFPSSRDETARTLPSAGCNVTQAEANAPHAQSTRHPTKVQQHVVEAERHVVHQKEIVAELERNGHKRALALARKVLMTLEQSLQVAREHCELESRDKPPRAPLSSGDGPSAKLEQRHAACQLGAAAGSDRQPPKAAARRPPRSSVR